mgnify:CR=1 FL=1
MACYIGNYRQEVRIVVSYVTDKIGGGLSS